MPYPDRVLADDEEVVRHLHPHWLTVLRPVLWLLLVVGSASFAMAGSSTGVTAAASGLGWVFGLRAMDDLSRWGMA